MPTPIFNLKGKSVYVAGDKGLAGSAIVRRLATEDCEILSVDRDELDLTRRDETERWICKSRPDVIIVAAGKVGGIAANAKLPVDFLEHNLAIALNVIQCAHLAGVKKLLYLGSSCIYPRLVAQPMTENMLMTGVLEPTNEGYALAKILGIKLVEFHRRQHGSDFLSVVPTNLYGPGDNYHPEHAHVPAALIRRFHEAKVAAAPVVTIWGTGQARREFLASDDLADACVFLLKHYSGDGILNIGTGTDIAIADFARMVSNIVGYKGELFFDTSRPDGMPRKLLNVSRLTELGWRSKINLEDGIATAYADFLSGGGRR